MNLRKSLMRLALALGLTLAAAWAQAQGVAMVLDRAGEAEVASGAKTARLNVLDYLAPDSELRLGAGASATLVYLASSQEWQFTGPGRYKLQATQPGVLQGAQPKARGVPAPAAQAMVKLEPSQRERMALGAMVMRAGGPLRVLGPNSVDVLASRPTLLWQANEGLTVRVTVLDGSQNAVAQTTTSAMQWAVPADLAPGDYTWRIEPAGGDGAAAPRLGKFHVIDADDPRRGRIGAPPADFAGRLAYAVMLESEELPHDARLVWRALAAERPDEESLKSWAR